MFIVQPVHVVACHLVLLCCLLRCDEDMSWKACFVEMYKDFGRYIDIYRPIRKAWDQILAFTKKNCPAIWNGLLGMSLLFWTRILGTFCVFWLFFYTSSGSPASAIITVARVLLQ